MSIILGINYGHDGSVCIVRNGKLEIAIATERITRRKKDFSITDEVIHYVLNELNLSIHDIDYVATNDLEQSIFGNQVLEKELNILGRKIPCIVIPHHLAHCASAYYTSPFEKSYCLSVDVCSQINKIANSLVTYGEGNKLNALYCPQAMCGAMYGTVTESLGLGPMLHKAGTTMGLASYGEVYDFDFKSYTDDIKDKMNIAATAQHILEQELLAVVNDMDDATENLCLSGGTLLNCNANSKIATQSKFSNFHHFPACGDDGTSVGAALYVSHHILNEPRHLYCPKDLAYLGKSYQVQEPDYKLIAEELSKGKIIGWFQGKSEFGPRALGNRSILADPRNFHNRELINHVIKSREWFRPFAPVVLEEDYKDWFDFPIPSPFMLYTAKVKQPEKIPAVTHIDGSARFQTINQETNLTYYNLIKKFKEITGVPVLLNTSLNGNGEPILETEEEAIDFFKKSHLNLMVVNGKIYHK